MLHTDVLVDLQMLAHQLDLDIGVLGQLHQSLLNSLYLLRNCTENSFLQPIKLVETSPCSNLTQANKDAAHGLEVEGLVATKYQDETSQLHSQSLD